MSSSRAKPPPPKEMVTTTGVKVTVSQEPPPDPCASSFGSKVPTTQAVIVPPGLSQQEREAVMKSIDARYRPWIQAAARREGGISEDSTQDLAQRVLLIVCAQIEARREGVPRLLWERARDGRPLAGGDGRDDVKAYLQGIARNEARNYKRGWKPPIAPGADGDDKAVSTPGPAGRLSLAEERARLARYVGELPAELADVVRCLDFEAMSGPETAAHLGIPLGTVKTRHARAVEALEERARASDRREGR